MGRLLALALCWLCVVVGAAEAQIPEGLNIRQPEHWMRIALRRHSELEYTGGKGSKLNCGRWSDRDARVVRSLCHMRWHDPFGFLFRGYGEIWIRNYRWFYSYNIVRIDRGCKTIPAPNRHCTKRFVVH